MQSVAVFIGRFSPFHAGHAFVLENALRKYRRVLVLVGSSFGARTIKNPLTYEERKQIITEHVSNTLPQYLDKLSVCGVRDYPYNDSKWIQAVQSAVLSFFDDTKLVLVGTNKDESSYYTNIFGDFFDLDLNKTVWEGISATYVRERFLEDGSVFFGTKVPASTSNFLAKFKRTAEYARLKEEFEYIKQYKALYSNFKYPVTIQTVDTCVIQSGHVLVATRSNLPGKGLWCLPGGHLNPNERLLDAAIRELREETDIEMSKAQLYGSVKAQKEFDHPERSLKGRVITMCYLLMLDNSKPLPKIKPQKGEASKVEWLPIGVALDSRENWFDDHYDMLDYMVNLNK